MPPHAQGHPTWCESPLAPDDSTHTHTAAIGTAHLAADATAELVLVQGPDAFRPTLTLHLVTPTARLSIDMTGTQAWALAGVLIDATVAHAHAAPSRSDATSHHPLTPSPQPPDRDARPLWLLDQHPNGRMPPARRRRSFRCLGPRPQKVEGDDPGEAGAPE
jgi:hypothetical protein